jgi:cytoskeletal protein CcmA (bactofilin family)
MFTKGNKEDENNRGMPNVPCPPSLLSMDFEIIGEIRSAGEVQIDGIVNGNIIAQQLIVGETAQITGNITAETVNIHGRVKGQVQANTVSLAKTAHILGDVLHGNIAIEKGAFLEGHCRRIEIKKKLGDGGLKLLVKGVAKDKSDQPPKNPMAELV